MRPVPIALSFACLLASAVSLSSASLAAIAQKSKHAHAQPAQMRIIGDAGEFCSAGLHVQRGSGSGLIAVKQKLPDPQTRNVPQQRDSASYHLTTDDKQVARMQLTAHGYSHRDRLLLLNDAPSSDLAKAIDARFHPDDEGTPTSNMALANFAGVTSVDVDSITYADGSTWHATAGHTCAVKPDGFVLVAAR